MSSRKKKHISPLVANETASLTKVKESRTVKHKSDSNNPNYAAIESKRIKLKKEQEEERRLTSLLFGGSIREGKAWTDYDEDFDGDYNQKSEGLTNDDTGALFLIDRVGQNLHSTDDADVDIQETNKEENFSSSISKTVSAWVDEDDADLKYSLMASDRTRKLRKSTREDIISGLDYEARLRERHTVTRTAQTDWAECSDDDDGRESEADSATEEKDTATRLLSSTKSLLASSSIRLQPHIINVVRCPDANLGHYNSSTVNVVQFHPGSEEDEPLMMTGGLDKTLRFFKMNSESSQKVHGIHFPNMPIHCASFLGDTGSIAVSGRRKFFYIYDAESGKVDKVPSIQGRKERSLEKFVSSPDGGLIAFIGNDGYIILVEAKSKLWVADLKMNGSARAVSFSPCGDFITASGSDGEVYR